MKERAVRETLAVKSRDIAHFLQSIVHSETDAEDLFQSGSVRALERLGELKDPEKTYPWLLSLFRNLALDFLRANKTLKAKHSDLEPEAFENLPDTAPDQNEGKVCGCGTKLLDTIPQQYSSLLKNVEIEGNSVTHVAKELGTSANNISVRLHRARASLKQAVQDHCQVETLKQCMDCDCDD